MLIMARSATPAAMIFTSRPRGTGYSIAPEISKNVPRDLRPSVPFGRGSPENPKVFRRVSEKVHREEDTQNKLTVTRCGLRTTTKGLSDLERIGAQS